MDHVVIRRLEHLTRRARAPALGYAVEMRERPGPAHKSGAYPDDVVWIQIRGGLFVGKAAIELCWVGEYGGVEEIRRRTARSAIHDVTGFWAGRPRFGFAAVAGLKNERWIEPFWAGPRTYGYEWVLLETDKKRSAWLDPKPPPRDGDELLRQFLRWRQR